MKYFILIYVYKNLQQTEMFYITTDEFLTWVFNIFISRFLREAQGLPNERTINPRYADNQLQTNSDNLLLNNANKNCTTFSNMEKLKTTKMRGWSLVLLMVEPLIWYRFRFLHRRIIITTTRCCFCTAKMLRAAISRVCWKWRCF